jgi:diacylglycerol kinase family enzyme
MARRRKHFGVAINAKAGTARGLDHQALSEGLRLIAKHNNATIDLVISDGKEIGGEVDRLKQRGDIDALIVGGGDGTVSTSAAQVMVSDLVLGVIPLGTMNYFARTLRLPLDPLQAFESLVAGKTAAVDTGQVNGELFLHHVSLGLQPDMIRERKNIGYQSRVGKIMASTQAFLRIVRRARRMMLDATLGEEHVFFTTSALIVSNNELGDSLPPIAERLDGDTLGIYSVKSHHWLDLLWLSKDAALGRWKSNGAIDIHTAKSLTITPAPRFRRSDITVSVDGELRRFTGKIEIDIRPKSLKVLKPSELLNLVAR